MEYYRVSGSLYPHVLYRYDPNTREWWHWIVKDQIWEWFKREAKRDTKEKHLRNVLPKANKLEVLLVWGSEAVKG
jgi:hypothetical protein